VTVVAVPVVQRPVVGAVLMLLPLALPHTPFVFAVVLPDELPVVVLPELEPPEELPDDPPAVLTPLEEPELEPPVELPDDDPPEDVLVVPPVLDPAAAVPPLLLLTPQGTVEPELELEPAVLLVAAGVA
jgi:hypothetical protein